MNFSDLDLVVVKFIWFNLFILFWKVKVLYVCKVEYDLEFLFIVGMVFDNVYLF